MNAQIIKTVEEIQSGCYLLRTFEGEVINGSIRPMNHTDEDVFIVTNGEQYTITFTTGENQIYEADELRSAIENWMHGDNGYTKWQLITK
jgi:hypothetical protein